MQAAKSCVDCPSYMTADEAQETYKRNPGVPVCVKLGKMLAKPNFAPSQAKKVAEKFASDCGEFGKPRPESFASLMESPVILPDPEVTIALGQTGGISEPSTRPNSCTGCRHFIDERVVMDDLKWAYPLCAATGRLIDRTKAVSVASRCVVGERGPNRDTTLGLIEMPIYTESFGAGVSVRAGAFTVDPTKAGIDPHEYPTDRDVTQDELDSGIRAWRKLVSSDGSRFIELPIFRIDFFSEADQAKIPVTGCDEHPEWYIDHDNLAYDMAALWMGVDDTPVLIGDAGNGKTELGRYMAYLMCLPFERISITRTSEVDDLIGKMMFLNNETAFQYGRIPLAWQRPCVLLLDEPNVGPDEVWQAIRPLTDNSKQLVLDQSGGERVARNAYCFFMLAQNPEWNPIYVGTNSLNQADGTRLAPIAVGLPPVEVEREILVRHCQANEPSYEPDAVTLDKIMKIAADIRAMAEEGSLPVPWGLRENIKVARLSQWFDLPKAYRRTIVDRLEPDTGKLILSVVSTYCGS